jgi:hypothetical protein
MTMIFEDMVSLAPAGPQDIGHDRAWWDSESARLGTDWPSVVDTAIALLVMAGFVAPERRRQ